MKKRHRKQRFSHYVSSTNLKWYFVGLLDGEEVTKKLWAANKTSAAQEGKQWAEARNKRPDFYATTYNSAVFYQ